jgi:hypothetical protein
METKSVVKNCEHLFISQHGHERLTFMKVSKNILSIRCDSLFKNCEHLFIATAREQLLPFFNTYFAMHKVIPPF